jgi:hypothetical protein
MVEAAMAAMDHAATTTTTGAEYHSQHCSSPWRR